MRKKKALITGVSGQDGAYLSNFLLKKNYIVTGGERNKKKRNFWRLKELSIEKKIKIIHFDLLDKKLIIKTIKNGDYDEIYNLAAQSYVDKSFENPLYTSDVNALGVIRILEAIRKYSKKTKFYQASSSEMYGNVNTRIQDENTSFNPISPYAIAKLHAHWILGLYREAYNIFCCSGILFNHDSPLRGDDFVTKKIVRDLFKVKFNLMPCTYLGNIYAKRDWGYSADYVEAMWKMLQQKKASDFVISSGMNYTVKSFVNEAAKNIGFNLKWVGKDFNERGIDTRTKRVIVRIKKEFFRPIEINSTFGNPAKAKKLLKWTSKTKFKNLVKIMCNAELKKYE
tara:strand:- start:2062 stop:3081 length:1020 start_codon:yes stop_codon:yes gene_type:complete